MRANAINSNAVGRCSTQLREMRKPQIHRIHPSALRPRAVASPERQVSSSSPSPPIQARPLQSSSDLNLVFVDDDTGQRIQVMPADYGFRSGTGRLYQDGYGQVPTNVFALAGENFRKELLALRRSVRLDEFPTGYTSPRQPSLARRAAVAIGNFLRGAMARVDVWLEGREVLPELRLPKDARSNGLTPEQLDIVARVGMLQLNDAAVVERERRREATEGPVEAPWVVRFAFASLCWVLDVIYADRPIQRFWVLETVARMPYFAFISMLHLYESLGWWRAGADLRKVHFAEELNELHHLQIMETLGGDALWTDRFLAQHAAVFYYWVLVAMYLVSPSASYAFCELVEHHAADTYSEFVEQNEELLKSIPPPLVALNYYKAGDLYLFDQLQTGWPAREPRRPPCASLYDVFINVRNDEIEHIRTMMSCKDGSIAQHLANTMAMPLRGELMSSDAQTAEEEE